MLVRIFSRILRCAGAGALTTALLAGASPCALAQAPAPETTQRWVQLLASGNAEERNSAALLLLTANDPAALEALRRALTAENPEALRVAVIKAFQFRGNDQAADLMIAALDDKSAAVRQAASEALSAIRTPRALAELQTAVENPRYSLQVRAMVIAILGEMRDWSAAPALIRLLSAPDELIAKSARAALQQITFQNFASGAEWQDWWDRARKMNRVQLLETIIAQQNEQLTRQTRIIDRLYLQMLNARQDADNPTLLIEALQESGSARVKTFAIEQLALLQAKSDEDRRRTAAALMAAMQDADAAVRSKAIEAIGARKEAGAAADLIRSLEDPIPFVREAAARALGPLRDTAAVASLCQRLTDTAPEVVAAAAASLGQIGDPRAIPPLVRLLDQNPAADSKIHETTGKALAAIKDPAARQIIADKLLQSPNAAVRFSAVRALGGHDAVTAIPLLAEVVRNDPTPQIRSAAVTSLAETKSPEALPAIVAALSDKDPDVQQQAFRALLDLAGGQPERYAVALDALLQQQRYETADQVLERASDQLRPLPNMDAALTSLRARLAKGLLAARQWGRARGHYERLIADAPANAEYLRALTTCLKELKESDALLKVLAQARRSAPNEAAFWWQETTALVEGYAAEGQWKAVADTVAALELEDPALGGAAEKLRALRSKALDALQPKTPAPPEKPPAP